MGSHEVKEYSGEVHIWQRLPGIPSCLPGRDEPIFEVLDVSIPNECH